MDEQELHGRQVDETFDRIFGPRAEVEPVPVSLLRTTTKTVVSTYPENHHRTEAVKHLIDAAGHLRKAEAAGG